MNEALLTGLVPARRASVEKALSGDRLTPADASALVGARGAERPALWAAAAHMRDLTRPPIVTYSRKVFIPLTNLCRDVCSYCTFAVDEDGPRAHTMSPDEVLAMAQQAKDLGCKEALFCIGDRPEVRWPKYRDVLRGFGHESTQSYLVAMCRMVMEETGLLPHPNAGIMSERELRELREVSPSQGIMLESTSERLCAPGGPHEHAPDKKPRTRLAMLRRAGKLRIPFTTGILIGLGETEDERVDALLAIRDLHDEYGHIQEIIVQNFRAKAETPMADADEPGLELGERAAEGLTVGGVGDGLFQGGLSDGGALDTVRHATGDQGLHQGTEGTLLAAQKGVLAHFAVLKHQLCGVGGAVAHLLELAGDLEPGGVPVNDEHRDAPAAHLFVGVRRHKAEVADGAVGDEVLAAVDDVAAVLLVSTGGQTGHVGPGVRLGDGVRTDGLTGDGGGKVFVTLLLGAELVDREHGEIDVGVHRHGDSGAHLGHLLHEDALGDLASVNAAVLLGEDDAEQSQFTELRHDLNGKRLVALSLLDERGDLRLGELAHHGADLFLLIGE